ncbi:MBL fold metallo-hydrolase [Sorangium sp. So ce1097]|uniref:MBL fold metallo-hydrolase n=1 Tax=Sorangium sp. So ce1097 TaxID=3133330 RepID=UPI003F631F80
MRPSGASRVPEPKLVSEILPEHMPDGMLSIAVFGPGEGEAIVVRLPDGSVGVVDGCREPEAGAADGAGDPVRELLGRLAAKTPNANDFRLGFVCLTHPHADHYRGLGRLLDAYEGRVNTVWKVTHLTPQHEKALVEWLELTRAGEAPDEEVLTGLKRVIDRFNTAKHRCRDGYRHLLQGRQLFSRRLKGHKLFIDACGPADVDIDNAGNELFALLTEARETGTVSRKHDPNLTSGALLLRWGRSAALLAGDLLRGSGPQSGWQLARKQLKRRVQVVNVAHHASEGAHDEALWTAMAPELAIVTPFKQGTGDNPPRPDRILTLARTSVVAITSPPDWKATTGLPVGTRSTKPKGFKPKNNVLPSITRSKPADARRNAVAVSLDAAGNITSFYLAGEADIYLAPDEARASAAVPKVAAFTPRGKRPPP